MILRPAATVAIGCLGLALLTAPAHAQYGYGSYGGFEDAGFSVLIEGLLTNPRNTDAVVAVTQDSQGTVTSILPDWDDEVTGRVAFGYGWSSGNRLTLAVWSFRADQQAVGSGPAGGTTHFAIGPPIPDGAGGHVGQLGQPGSFDVLTEIEAWTADLAWSRGFEAGNGFELDWSVGLRVANFEETLSGTYGDAVGFDPGAGPLAAQKSNEAEMVGLRGGLRASYRLPASLSLEAGLGLSLMDGELTAESGLTASGTVGGNAVGPSSFRLEDDGRSGTIRELDVALKWTSQGGAWSAWVGWEQSEWKKIVSDLARNFPGSTAVLRERDSATFSGYRLGVGFDF